MNTGQPPIRVGIVGLGRSGYGIHCATLKTCPGWKIVAVADIDASRAAAVALEFEAVACVSIDTLLTLEKVDLVVVAAPNALHVPYTIQSLRAGKHVVCEKPFGLTVDDVDTMIAARGGKILAPFQNRRYEQAIRTIRDVVRSGVLGPLVHMRTSWHGYGRRWDWQTLTECAGGQLNNNLSHPIDQMLALWEDLGWDGSPEPEVWSSMRNVLSLGDAEDHVRLTLRIPGHPEFPTVDIEFTAASPYPQEQYHIMATWGGLTATAAKVRWKWIDPDTLPPRTATKQPTPDRSYNREDLTWHEETVDCTESIMDAQRQYYADLRRTIVDGAPLPMTPEVIRRRIRILELARENAR